MPCYGCVAVVCIHGSVAWYPELIPVIPLETSESENHRKIAETHFETSWKPRETTVNECVLPESLTWNYLKQLRSGLKSRFSATLTHFLFLGPWQIFGVFSLFLKNFCAIHWFSKWFLTVFYGFWVVSTGFKVVSKQFSVFSSVFHWFAKGLRVSALEYQLSHGGGGTGYNRFGTLGTSIRCNSSQPGLQFMASVRTTGKGPGRPVAVGITHIHSFYIYSRYMMKRT